ncbi:MAG: DUF4430 domain-containing protein [Bacillota bacterium]
MNNRNMSQRFFALFSIMLLVIFQVLSFVPQQVEAAALTNGATISAVDQDGNKVLPLTAVEVEDGQTAFDILKEVTEEQEVAFDYSIDPQWGAFISSIGGIIPEGNYYWGFIVNGEGAQVGASSYSINKGDSILFKVISFPAETVNVKVSAKDQKGNSILEETVEVVKGASSYDALKLAGKTVGVNIDTSIDPAWFAYINNIGDVELGEYDYWSTYMNEGYMVEGLSADIVDEGDHLELVVESWTPPTDGEDNGSGDEDEDEDSSEPDSGNETKSDPNNTPEVDPLTKEQVNTAIQSTTKYILKKGINDEFAAVALKATEEDVPQQYIEKIKLDIIAKNGVYRNVTDYQRIVLGLTAAGIDATNFAGYDLIKKIYSNERMTNQGNNGVIYALLAYDSGNYEIPNNAEWKREKLVNYLLDQQLENGGWSLFGSTASVDITGMSLTALAPYKEQENVQAAINKAVEWISSVQDSNGGFSNDTNGGDASETTAQVIIGLASVGVNPTEERFTKQAGDLKISSLGTGSTGVNLIQHLLTFKQEDGGFAHLQGDDSNLMASTQALLALTAYDYYLSGKGSIYQFNKPELEVAPVPVVDKEETPESDKNEVDESKNVEDQPNTDKPINKKVENESTTSEGHRLPNTATPLFNLLAGGGTLLVIGSTIFIYSNRRKTNKV